MFNLKTVLTAAVLAGSAVAAPAAANSCTTRSSQISGWTVENFDYHADYTFSTPAHQNSWGFTNFTLANKALGYKTICSAQSNQLEEFFYGTQNYNCTLPKTGPSPGDMASFNYSYPSGVLNVNQTWHCADEGSVFWGQGSVKLNLSCSETKWQNPNWKMGQIYSTRNIDCKKVTEHAAVDSLQAIA